MAGQTIALLTDFGNQDIYAGVLKGILSTLAPQARLIDLSHGVPRGDISSGALMLWQASPYFQPGTIFLAVVDPGVGSARAGIAAVWPERAFVGPDNGLISFLVARDGSPQVYLLPDHGALISDTFHGRDIFAPAAAHIASGLAAQELGPSTDEFVLLQPPRLRRIDDSTAEGQILHIDPFGNAVTSIGRLNRKDGALLLDPWIGEEPAMVLLGSEHSVRLPDGEEFGLHRTFSDVQPGKALAYVGSSGLLEIGINQGAAAKEYSLTPGQVVQLRAKG